MKWLERPGSKILSVPEERQSDQLILFSICKAELGELNGREREQHQTRRQILIPSPLQTEEEFPRNTVW